MIVDSYYSKCQYVDDFCQAFTQRARLISSLCLYRDLKHIHISVQRFSNNIMVISPHGTRSARGNNSIDVGNMLYCGIHEVFARAIDKWFQWKRTIPEEQTLVFEQVGQLTKI